MEPNITPKLRSHFLNLFTIALSDTSIAPIELKFLYELGIQKGIRREDIDYIIQNPHKVRFYEPKTVYDKIESLYDLAQMVLADGVVDPREVAMCSSLARRFGFEEENIPELVDFLIEEARKGTDVNNLLETVKETIA